MCLLQSLSTFPEKVSESNLKAVNALKNVGKGTMERVSDVLEILPVPGFFPGEGVTVPGFASDFNCARLISGGRGG